MHHTNVSTEPDGTTTRGPCAMEDALNITLHSGAVVYLQQLKKDREGNEPGFVWADGFAHTDVRVAPERNFDFTKALFRIVPRLQYTTANKKGYSQFERDHEHENNQATLSTVGTPLFYSSVIQLQHLQSGKFLTVDPKRGARVDSECLAVRVTENGSENSWFQLKPSMKVRTPGSEVFYGDEIKLSVDRVRAGGVGDTLLHASKL